MAQSSPATAQWLPLGPAAVQSPNYGLVTGRITSLALDPADVTGNRLYVGSTGGGVWLSTNAAASDPGTVQFAPLTDDLGALATAHDASISIGAVTVQPGGTGVVLAGTGDPNDALDSYYGAGILRSGDGGTTWTLVQTTSDQKWAFVGEGFAGFAWSDANPQLVVAAVSQAWEGLLVDATRPNLSYEGLYYSSDAGITWSLARIADQTGTDIQGPSDAFAGADGNAATSVIWNPKRQVFLAAVRYHGYYQSADGMNWTRLTTQPGTGLTTTRCPTNSLRTGSIACPIYRGTLAVNPSTGDTFAWTIDGSDQDQGIWQDVCGLSGGVCTNSTISFGTKWDTSVLESVTALGSATIFNGDYNLTLAAVPASQDTTLLAGGNDLWSCGLAMGCVWRNTTHAFTCMSAAVGGYQHALAWNPANPQEIFSGNDSGLWRSMDAIGETGSSCASTDASHFQNLNGSLGSLAEVASMSPAGSTPYTMMAGLGANGAAASNSTSQATTTWPEILGGEGGPVAVDPSNSSKWYVNNGLGVSIHACAKGGACTPADFGQSPAVSNSDVSGDGLVMPAPATFLVDPADPTQLLVGTCRIWRGPATGGWTTANAVSPMFDGNRSNSACSGNALIRSLAAMNLPGGGEVVYAGTYGFQNGGAALPGHVLSATLSATGTWSNWQDLTLNPVTNDSLALNAYNLDISSLTIDANDVTGNTVYVTVAGIPGPLQLIQIVYRSTDGGAHWSTLKSNLPSSPANSVAIDPVDPNIVYLALDSGVYFTRTVANCPTAASNCWSAYGTGLPMAPVVALSAAPLSASVDVLVAGTYGRGVWQIPLATAGVQLTTGTTSPNSLNFGHRALNSISSPQTVTLTAGAGFPLNVGQIVAAGDFAVPTASDTCSNHTLNAAAQCTVAVTFSPSQTGSRTGQLTIPANVTGAAIAVPLSGIGDPGAAVSLSPGTLDFAPVGPVQVGTTSKPLAVTVNNSASTAIPITSLSVSAPFVLAGNSCGSTSLAANTSCAISVEFLPTQSGPATGTLTLVDSLGTQMVQLTGTGVTRATDTLSAGSLTFPATTIGHSASLTLTLTNNGDLPLTGICATTGATCPSTAGGPFQASTNCTTQLTGHASCTITVVFAPTQTGSATGTLTVSDILQAGQKVALTGTGQLPAASDVVQIVPAQVNFPTVGVGASSDPVVLSIVNAKSGPTLTGLTLSASPGFKLVNNTCGQSLAASGTCTTGVVFAPVATGPMTGTFTVTSSALSSATTAHLTGAGFDFSVTGSGAQTVSSGQTGNYALTITPAIAVSAGFTFACGTLPSYAACVFNPVTNTVSAGATGTEAVQITTAESSSAGVRRPGQLGLLVAGFLGVVLIGCKRRALGMLLVSVYLVAGVASCSSSGGGTSGGSPPSQTNHTTPAGTYSIPVTVTSAGLQHSVTLTLTVD